MMTSLLWLLPACVPLAVGLHELWYRRKRHHFYRTQRARMHPEQRALYDRFKGEP